MSSPAFYSPEEQAIMDLLLAKGAMKQTQVIKELEGEVNACTAKELLANLVRRNGLYKGAGGYEVRCRAKKMNV